MALSRTDYAGQISGTTGNFGTGNWTTASYTIPANSAVLVVGTLIENNGTTTDPTSAFTLSDSGSHTWTAVSGASAVSSATSFPTCTKAWTAEFVSGATVTLTFSTGGRSIGVYAAAVASWTGYQTGTPTGATASGQQNGGFSGPPTPFSITLTGAPASTSEVVGVAGMDKSVAGTTPGSAFTETADVENTTWGGLEAEVRGSSTSTTVDWADLRSGGGALFNVAAVAVEIVAASATASATPGPVVVTRPAPVVMPLRPVFARNTLQDPPVLTTASPVVVSRTVPPQPPLTPIISRSSLVDVAVPAVSTPEPIVVTGPPVPVQTGPAIVLRSTLADPPVLTTPRPLIVTPPERPPNVTPALTLRSSLQDLTTPPPLVVTRPWIQPQTGPAILSRSSLADTPVVTGAVTPEPLVVTSTAPVPWTYRPLILSAIRPGIPFPSQISGDPVPYPNTEGAPVALPGQEESGAVSAVESASFAVSGGIQ